MKLPKVTNFPAEYRDIVQRLADAGTTARRRSIRCPTDKEARAMQWHFYRYLTALDKAPDTELPFPRETLRAFRQCYALKAEGTELVFLPRSDSPRARVANSFLMELMQEGAPTPSPGAAEPAPEALPAAPDAAPGGGMFAPSGHYATQPAPAQPAPQASQAPQATEPPPTVVPGPQPPTEPPPAPAPGDPVATFNPAWLDQVIGKPSNR